MKIFISHASLDKWAARRISNELNAIGAKTFLDEKDIETGDSIDSEIRKHLKSSDEVLILLSPASVKSHWVLVEVGGAQALEKRLVPILLYLGANDIPSPINKTLARDINSIEAYYEELKKRIGNPQPAPTYVPRARVPVHTPTTVFKVGDKVQIASMPQPRAAREKYVINWKPEMDQFCGKTAVVVDADTDRTVHLDIDSGEDWWAMEWLRKAT